MNISQEEKREQVFREYSVPRAFRVMVVPSVIRQLIVRIYNMADTFYIPYLKYETVLTKPRMIVCLGRIAASRILHPDYRITKEHGHFLERKRVWMTAVFHPSAVLRDESKLPLMQEDFRKIREKLDELLLS